MMFKRLIFCLLLLPLSMSAQHYEWADGIPHSFSLNPGITWMTCTTDASDRLIFSSVDSVAQLYGSDTYSKQSVHAKVSTGPDQYTYMIGEKALIRHIAADSSGNTYICGEYMETLNLNNTDSLNNLGTGFNINLFLFSLDASGNLRWKQNLSSTFTSFSSIDAITVNRNGNIWISLGDFIDNTLIELNPADGSLLSQRPISNTKRVTGLSFDAANNLYIAGSTGMGTMSFGGQSYNVPESYMLFIGRYDATGNASWLHLGHDITFTAPEVVATADGGAYFAGQKFDTLNFNGVGLPPAQWNNDYFIYHVDSSGNFQWGRSLPQTPVITGSFTVGTNHFLSVDHNGYAIIGGLAQGVIDWGNNVIMNTGGISLTLSSMVSYDDTGLARWTIGGGSAYNNFHSLSSAAGDNLYFVASVRGPAVFGAFNFNVPNVQSNAYGKVAYDEVFTGIITYPTDRQSLIFPNPADTYINLPEELQSPVITVYSMDGRKQLEMNSNDHKTLDVSSFAPGIYLLKTDKPNAPAYRFAVR